MKLLLQYYVIKHYFVHLETVQNDFTDIIQLDL